MVLYSYLEDKSRLLSGYGLTEPFGGLSEWKEMFISIPEKYPPNDGKTTDWVQGKIFPERVLRRQTSSESSRFRSPKQELSAIRKYG